MTQSYATFLAEPVKYTICRYGESDAVGFRGLKADVQKAVNMFLNLGGERRVTWVNDSFAYMSTSLPRLKHVIKLHLYLMIMMNKEVEVTESWDDETGEYALQQNEKAANDLAEIDAHHFLSTLETESFVPSRQFAY